MGGAVVAVVVGALLSLGAAIGGVQLIEQTPEPHPGPITVYGER